MTKRCARCKVSESDIKLFDAIYNGKMDCLCERCSVIDNVPIIKIPTLNQLKRLEEKRTSNKPQQRATYSSRREDTFVLNDKLKELETHPELELPEIEKLNLSDNFHWQIMKIRRNKGITIEKLAREIGESQKVLEMIEKGKIPENGAHIIRKIEQFFQVRLRKVSYLERMHAQRVRRPILLDEQGRVLDKIPEPEIKIVEEEDEDEEEIKKSDIKIVKFEDLNIRRPAPPQPRPEPIKERTEEPMSFQRRKIEVTKREKIEEQRKIEERQKMIEARKEEMRLMREKESKDLDNMLGGKELLD